MGSRAQTIHRRDFIEGSHHLCTRSEHALALAEFHVSVVRRGIGAAGGDGGSVVELEDSRSGVRRVVVIFVNLRHLSEVVLGWVEPEKQTVMSDPLQCVCRDYEYVWP